MIILLSIRHLKRSIFFLSSMFIFLNSYSQSKLIYSKSKGAFDSGTTPSLMIYDLNKQQEDLLYEGAVKGRGEYSVALSPGHSKIIVNTYQFGGWKLGIADFNGEKIGKFSRFTSGSSYEFNANWSSSGAYVAYQDFNWSTGDTEIFIADKFGKNKRQFTNSAGGDRSPCWTMNDESIVFTSGRGGDYDIYIQGVKNGNAINLTNSQPSNEFAPSTSKVEDKIAFLSDKGGSIGLYIMNYDGSDMKYLSSAIKSDSFTMNGFESSGCWAYQTSWSDDGNYIVFNVMIDSNLEIFTIKKDGSELTRITNNSDSDFCPTWLD